MQITDNRSRAKEEVHPASRTADVFSGIIFGVEGIWLRVYRHVIRLDGHCSPDTLPVRVVDDNGNAIDILVHNFKQVKAELIISDTD